MDIMTLFAKIDPNLLAILVSAIIGLLTWLYKDMIVSPIKESKNIYYKYIEKRIESLITASNLLLSIAFSPSNNRYRNRLKDLSHSPLMAYLDEDENDAIMQIANMKTLNEEMLLKTSDKIRDDLARIINTIRKENLYFENNYAISPFGKILSYAKLLFQFILSITLLGLIVFFIVRLIRWKLIWGIFSSLVIILGFFFLCKNADKWIAWINDHVHKLNSSLIKSK